MHYPQFRGRPLGIAAQEQAHVAWLRDVILAHGGDIPAVLVTAKVTPKAWRAPLIDLEEERRSDANPLEALHLAEQAGPEVAAGLQCIWAAGRRHREALLDMLVKSAPSTLLHAPVEERAWGGRLQGRYEHHAAVGRDDHLGLMQPTSVGLRAPAKSYSATPGAEADE